ncbi:MAG TPA: hypothetical protein VFV94_20625 [Polyangiaceae bacterium]|nr:hypothetical protein [Polyangiaceae bacterium]
MSRFFGRTLGAVSTVVLVVAAGCGEEDDAPPAHQAGKGGISAAGNGGGGAAGTKGGTGGRSGASGRGGSAGSTAGRAGRGGTSPGGAGGVAGDHTAGTGADGGAGTGGETEFSCRSVTCVEETLAGDCPATAPNAGDPCTVGASCSYCFDSSACPDQRYGVIMQCCSGEWSHNCANQCFDAGGSGGAGGQGGARGESGAQSSAGEGGADNGDVCASLLTACCADDGDCPPGYECATEPQTQGTGVCKGKLADTSRCWMDADCPSDYRCEGALYCGCGDSCNDELTGTCIKR